MKAITIYQANDGSRWDVERDAIHRDALDMEIKALNATLPNQPNSGERIRVDPAAVLATKRAVLEVCKREFPNEEIFRTDAEKLHPMSYAGRYLSEVGGPINRIWWRFSCINGEWLYNQPFFALNPGEFERQYALKASR